MTSPGCSVFKGLFFLLQEGVYLAVNKSHLPEEPGEPVTAPPRARKRNRLTHSFSERPGKHCENKRGNKCTKKFPAFNYPQALFLVAQGQENTHLFSPQVRTHWDHLWVSPTQRQRMWIKICLVDSPYQQRRGGRVVWSSSGIFGLRVVLSELC